MLPDLSSFILPEPQGIKCPVCAYPLNYLQVSRQPPLPGIGGSLILCEVCASLVILDSLDPPNLRRMTQEEKQVLKDNDSAPIYKKIQETLAQAIGGSD